MKRFLKIFAVALVLLALAWGAGYGVAYRRISALEDRVAEEERAKARVEVDLSRARAVVLVALANEEALKLNFGNATDLLRRAQADASRVGELRTFEPRFSELLAAVQRLDPENVAKGKKLMEDLLRATQAAMRTGPIAAPAGAAAPPQPSTPPLAPQPSTPPSAAPTQPSAPPPAP